MRFHFQIGFLHLVFSQLLDNELVAADVFKKWETSADEPLGKGLYDILFIFIA